VIAADIGIYVVWAVLGLLLVRLIMDYVMMFARRFRPTGALAALLEIAYSVTDPPLRALRRVIPPLRLGAVSVDVSFIVLFIGCYVLLDVLYRYG
jgi:YggT family protein